MRSKLFVPASRPALFEKAVAGGADALSFDLEDSVVEARKDEARDALKAFFLSGALVGCGKTVVVRINAADTPHFADDIRAVVQPGVHLVNLPKPRSVEDVREASRRIAQAQAANHVDEDVRLLVNIETPFALRNAHALAAADPRVAGLQLGLGDLFEPLGVARRDASAVRQAMFAVRMAAGEAGVFAYDAAFADFSDQAGFTAEARHARDFGFLGKSCIHPSQVALANAVFQPDASEIAHAQRVVDAARKADSSGTGAYVVDGKMVDAPFVRRAEAVLVLARKLGLTGGAS